VVRVVPFFGFFLDALDFDPVVLGRDCAEAAACCLAAAFDCAVPVVCLDGGGFRVAAFRWVVVRWAVAIFADVVLLAGVFFFAGCA